MRKFEKMIIKAQWHLAPTESEATLAQSEGCSSVGTNNIVL